MADSNFNLGLGGPMALEPHHSRQPVRPTEETMEGKGPSTRTHLLIRID